MMREEEMVECPCCEGAGGYLDVTPNPRNHISGPPWRVCAFCGGRTTVGEMRAREYDPNTNYEEERKQEEADARYEAKRDRLLGL